MFPGNADFLQKYKEAEQQCRYVLRQYSIESNNLDSFYKHINIEDYHAALVGALHYTNDAELPELLNSYFAST